MAERQNVMSNEADAQDRTVTLLDYGAGNVRSIQNALTLLGFTIQHVTSAEDIDNAKRLIFPGVGAFGKAMDNLRRKGLIEPLKRYITSNRPFFGICIGMQLLFSYGDENDCAGLDIVPGKVQRFTTDKPVPHIGWNSLCLANGVTSSSWLSATQAEKYYFVHSYRVLATDENRKWQHAVTDYGERFISAIHCGRCFATQFHPEKSSTAGLQLIERFLRLSMSEVVPPPLSAPNYQRFTTELSKRIIACLDVRSNDDGDLVVTKGDQYDVREKSGAGHVRNLGKPVALAQAYYNDGADEITFLNITSFRGEPLNDAPMLAVLEQTSTNVFVPLCIGGGIRDYTDSAGVTYSSLTVAERYFRSGADKISIGSDAVLAAEQYYANDRRLTGESCIERISLVYGAQAVVVSFDPKRVWVHSAGDTAHRTIKPTNGVRGPNGEGLCWYQCTIKGGREGRDLDVVELAVAVSALGAGEILLNSMDADGQKNGFDVDLINLVCAHTTLPVIASSGAGTAQHFSSVFRGTNATAALAAGIFHRKEVPISAVKQHLVDQHIAVRL